MTEQKYPNSGALFKNDRKTADTHADYNGSFNIDGVEYWVNAWVKEGKRGKFFSLKVKPKGEAPAKPAASEPALADDEVPF